MDLDLTGLDELWRADDVGWELVEETGSEGDNQQSIH